MKTTKGQKHKLTDKQTKQMYMYKNQRQTHGQTHRQSANTPTQKNTHRQKGNIFTEKHTEKHIHTDKHTN